MVEHRPDIHHSDQVLHNAFIAYTERRASVCLALQRKKFHDLQHSSRQPKSPNPMLDPIGYAKEIERLRQAYAKAYGGYFREHCPDNGLPCRFTVHVVDVPDQAASYEFYGSGLLQRARPGKDNR